MWKPRLPPSLRRTGPGPLQKTPPPSTAVPLPARLRFQPGGRRWNGTSAGGNKTQAQQSRADRILSRLPPSMQKYTSRLRSAPLSHVAAFLVLHEATAVVPLLGLFGLFHYCSDWVPLGYMMEHYGGYVREGTARFEQYFTRKGWFGFGAGEEGEGEAELRAEKGDEGVLDRWASADEKYRIVVEVALAYAITKALLPVRVMASLWATPWFAGVVVRVRNILRGGGGRK